MGARLVSRVRELDIARKLPPAPRLLLVWMALAARDTDGEPIYWGGHRQLAEWQGITDLRTIREQLAVLRDAGLIEVRKRSTYRHRTHYVLRITLDDLVKGLRDPLGDGFELELQDPPPPAVRGPLRYHGGGPFADADESQGQEAPATWGKSQGQEAPRSQGQEAPATSESQGQGAPPEEEVLQEESRTRRRRLAAVTTVAPDDPASTTADLDGDVEPIQVPAWFRDAVRRQGDRWGMPT